jgi:hypothetical protein
VIEDKCKICGMRCQQQPSTDKLCDGCWEYISRLEDMMKYPVAVKLTKEALARAKKGS